ncbi:cutinase family protein [Nocardia cyriacigeorgica]|uniref:cutinase family protein n=1 Tax=Nocardia cyriacigeorgica TaxID=135487 RepID=UPI002B4B712A|nr:cutinase family protein [Nocardia cyriacigeorgica]
MKPASLAAAAVIAAGALTFTASPTPAVPIGTPCPALALLGIQGTGQSSVTADPLADTGLVGALVGPVVAAVPHLVQRAYISYPAGFGGAVPGGGPDPYAASVAEARRGLDAAVTDLSTRCPGTMIAGVGYSQGAQALSMFARDVGAGAGPVGADRVAAIVLYSNPDRAPGEPTFPGRPGQAVPDPVPGTTGSAVAGVALPQPPAAGGGIAGGDSGYGALAGRVADICVDGDLACSAPDHAALLRVGAQLAAQANLRDPLAALTSMQSLFSAALGDAWTTVLLNDFHIGPGTVDYRPQQSLAGRLIDAADPRIPAPTPDQTATAAIRWNEITATAMANPLVVLPTLAGQLSAAWGQLLADNADLVNAGVWVRYGDTVARHNGYAATGHLGPAIAWLIAAAHDIAGSPR